MRSGFDLGYFGNFIVCASGHRRVCGALSENPLFSFDVERSTRSRRPTHALMTARVRLTDVGMTCLILFRRNSLERARGLKEAITSLPGMMTIESGFLRQSLLLLFRRHHVINHMNDSVGSHRVRNFEHAHIIVIVLDH